MYFITDKDYFAITIILMVCTSCLKAVQLNKVENFFPSQNLLTDLSWLQIWCKLQNMLNFPWILCKNLCSSFPCLFLQITNVWRSLFLWLSEIKFLKKWVWLLKSVPPILYSALIQCKHFDAQLRSAVAWGHARGWSHTIEWLELEARRVLCAWTWVQCIHSRLKLEWKPLGRGTSL